MSKAWRLQAEMLMMAPDSPFVMTTAMLIGLAQAGEEKPVRTSVGRWVRELVEGKKLQSVSRGVYLNRLGHPRGDVAEVAQWIRRGAVLSLAWVLEQADLTNNHGDTYTCIIPTEPSWTPPRLATRDIPGVGRFRFYAMRVDLVDEAAGKLEDVFDQRFPYRRATPEKALLDWIYLGYSHRSSLRPPPLDIEAGNLNARRLARLAKGMEMSDLLDRWMARWKAYQADPAVLANAPLDGREGGR